MDKSGLVVSGRKLTFVLRTLSIFRPETTRPDLSIIALGTALLHIQIELVQFCELVQFIPELHSKSFNLI